MVTPFEAMNAVGLVAFAIVGSLKAADAEFDVLGVAVLGVLTALGGGATRDVLVGRVPAMLQSTWDVGFALLGVAVAVLLARRVGARLLDHPVVMLPDAIGLAAFATTGALVGHDAGVTPFGVVVLGTVTGVGGGLVSDVLLQRVPFVLAEDFYATCAVAGSATFWLAVEAGASTAVGAGVCAALTLSLRVVALRRNWRLPTVRLRAES
ncbi:trimeric intracellular cation channel family protein [Halobacterium litoreum]|uniref:Trimeric intracellular cation channel family protein n=1 Tax=Halobacterium litoreum TaxID=2039234 RepID=A0ABD5NGW0_9EURY|nr:trimeric intracellular cation channel family protein [Halobacterium litoreum]UHH12742.1 trimeric intracellular cation channel family protein [Halobacterium litoreum]